MSHDDPKQPDLIAELQRTRPVADPTFQQQLEDRLMERRRKTMIRTRSEVYDLPVTKPKNTVRRFTLPLTLMAAVLALVVIGLGLLMFSGGDKSPHADTVPIQNNDALLQDATATMTATATLTSSPTMAFTATPIPTLTFTPTALPPTSSPIPADMLRATPTMIPPDGSSELLPTVVPPDGMIPNIGIFAVNRDTPRGTILTADMLQSVSYSGDTTGFVTDIGVVIGSVLAVDLRAYSPIRNDQFIRGVQSETITRTEAGVATYDLGEDAVAVNLPLNAEQVYLLAAGDTVRIQAAIQPLPEYEPLRQIWDAGDGNNLVTLAETATILSIGLQPVILDQSSTIVSDTITLRVTAEQAELMTWVYEAGYPLVYEVVFEE